MESNPRSTVHSWRPLQSRRLAKRRSRDCAQLRTANTDADAAMLRRLAVIGFVAREPVQLLRRGPGGREPLAVQVGDTLFALRTLEARCIEVAAQTKVTVDV